MNKPSLSIFTLVLGMSLAVGHALATSAPGSKLTSRLTHTVPAATLDVQQWTTAEGAQVRFVHSAELPMFDLRLDFAAGSAHDGDKPGLAALTNSMLNEGTLGQDAYQLALALESQGALFSNRIDPQHSTAWLRSLSNESQRLAAFRVFKDMVSAPSVPQAPFVQVREQLLQRVDGEGDPALDEMNRALANHLFSNHPYANPLFGTRTSVANLTASDVRAFHARAYTAANLSITLVGDLSREQAQAMTTELSAALPKGPAVQPLPAAQPAEPEVIHLERPGPNMYITVATSTLDRSHPDYAAVLVGTAILGGDGFNSRLMQALRVKHGITYEVDGSLTNRPAGSTYSIAWQTEPRYNQASQNAVEQLVRDYLAQGPDAAEVARVQQSLSGREVLKSANNEQILGNVSSLARRQAVPDEAHQLLKKVQALTPAAVTDAMNRHFDADRLVYISSGPTVPQEGLPVLPNE